MVFAEEQGGGIGKGVGPTASAEAMTGTVHAAPSGAAIGAPRASLDARSDRGWLGMVLCAASAAVTIGVLALMADFVLSRQGADLGTRGPVGLRGLEPASGTADDR